jgi:hypothetical protein
MAMQIKQSVKDIDKDGNATIEVMITRMIMNAQGPAAFTYDTNEENKDAPDELKSLAAMVNAPFIFKVSNQGKLLEADSKSFVDALTKAGAAAEMIEQLKQTMDQFSRNTMVALPDNPVKKGDIFDAGAFTQPIPGMGSMTAAAKYKVIAVSADKKQVLLEPIIELKLNNNEDSPIKIDLKKADMSGWMLFDVNTGEMQRSGMDADMDISVQGQDGTSVQMQMITKLVIELVL